MNRKRLTTMVVAVALVAIVGIGATLAYFTDQKSVENVFTMGEVKIDLWETGEDGPTSDGLTFEELVPGDTVSKDPTITLLDGSEDAYIRVKMNVSSDEISQGNLDILVYGLRGEDGNLLRNKDGSAVFEGLMAQIQASGDWKHDEEDGYIYYAYPLSNGEAGIKSARLFETVTIPPMWGNETASKTYYIEVQAYAIQANYLEDDVVIFENGKAVRWENLEYADFQ